MSNSKNEKEIKNSQKENSSKIETLDNKLDEINDEVFDIFDDDIDSVELSGVRKTRISGISKDIFLMKTKSKTNNNESKNGNIFNKKDTTNQSLIDLEFLKNKNFQFIFDKEFNTLK